MSTKTRPATFATVAACCILALSACSKGITEPQSVQTREVRPPLTIGSPVETDSVVTTADTGGSSSASGIGVFGGGGRTESTTDSNTPYDIGIGVFGGGG